jgi:hypothetical protein
MNILHDDKKRPIDLVISNTQTTTSNSYYMPFEEQLWGKKGLTKQTELYNHFKLPSPQRPKVPYLQIASIEIK